MKKSYAIVEKLFKFIPLSYKYSKIVCSRKIQSVKAIKNFLSSPILSLFLCMKIICQI